MARNRGLLNRRLQNEPYPGDLEPSHVGIYEYGDPVAPARGDMMGSTAPRSNMYQSALNNDVRDRGLGGTQYQAPGSNLDPTGFGGYASWMGGVPEWAGGGGFQGSGWNPPWGTNMGEFNEWFGEEYEGWQGGGVAGEDYSAQGMGSMYDYFETLSGSDVPSYSGWSNWTQGITPGGGSNYMQPGGAGGNIGGEGDLGYGSVFGGMGSSDYWNMGPDFGGIDCSGGPVMDDTGTFCLHCCG
jgi:hypothetical protein